MRKCIAIVLMLAAAAAAGPKKDPIKEGPLTKAIGPQPPNRVLEGHQGSVLWLSFTPDGKTLASSSRDHTVKIWDVANGKNTQTLTQPKSDVYCVSYSPDGTRLAACGIDNCTYLWSVPSYELQEALLSDALLRNLSFSPDGKTLATAGYNHEVWLWNIAKKTEQKKRSPKAVFKGHTGKIKAVEFSRSGKLLVSGGMEPRVLVWDPSEKEPKGPIKVLDSTEKSFEAVAISPDEKTVVGNSSHGDLIVWDLESGKILKTLTGHVMEGDSLAFRPDGKILASGNKDETITLWNTATWEPIGVFTGNKGRIESIAFSPDGKILANGGGGGDTTIKLWDVSGIDIK
jgi:WD40 repeat protein